MSLDAANQPSKRIRLSRACNQCRSRKVRCDEQQPSCFNCTRARVECVTSNPKNPNEDSAHSRRRAKASTMTPSSDYAPPLPNAQVTTHAESVRRSSNATRSPGWRQSSSVNATPFNDPQITTNGDSATIISEQPQDVHHDQQSMSSTDEAAPPRTLSNDRSPEFAVNAASALERKYLGSTSLQVFSQWLDLTFHIPAEGLSSSFQFGMRFCEEMDLPDDISMPQIATNWKVNIEAFFSCVGRFFPVVSGDIVHQWAQQMCQLELKTLATRQRPSVAILYACLAIGADTLGLTVEGSRYLTAACSLYAFLVAQPYLQSAQALVLICLALRGRNKDGAASQALGQAIRILHSIGLHKKLSGIGRPTTQQSELARMSINTWWSAYCLDRMMSLETGRPSHIHDDDVDQWELPQMAEEQAMEPLQALIGLARLQGNISKHLSTRKIPTIVEVLKTQCHLDQALVEWQKKLPCHLRSEADLEDYDPRITLPRAFLAIQFHSTMINLHRAALLMDKGIHQANLARYGLGLSDAKRLASSETICVNSARSIITKYLQARELAQWSRLQTMTGPLMAIYVLSINILKNPASWSARSDLGLIHSAAEAVEQKYCADGQDPGFYTMLKTLKQLASQDRLSTLTAAANAAPAERPTPPANTPRLDTQPSASGRNHSVIDTQGNHMSDPDLTDEWDMLFPRLYLGDLALDTEAFQGMNIEHLMGIPQLSPDELISLDIPPGFL